jgi:hypothetical protein
MKKSRIIVLLLVVFLALAIWFVFADHTAQDGTPPSPEQSTTAATNGDATIAELFAHQRSDVQVRGEGIVTKLLSDDNEGSRHQRFIIELSNGQTLLMTHNIDIAPRLEGLLVGDKVEFYGVYFFNDQGGGIHWTHHDPARKHIDGWLLWNGVYYR